MHENNPRSHSQHIDRLSNLRDFEVARDSPDVRGWGVVTSTDDNVGQVDDLIVDTRQMTARFLLVDLAGTAPAAAREERQVLVPVSRAEVDHSRRQVKLDVASAAALPPFRGLIEDDFLDQHDVSRPLEGDADANREAGDVRRITRSAEELKIGRREVPVGEVTVNKEVETEHVRVPTQRTREDVHVERRPASAAASGDIKDEQIRVPITEEELVVEKRPVVKEEIVVSKEAKTETVEVEEDVRKERVNIDRSNEKAADRGNRRR